MGRFAKGYTTDSFSALLHKMTRSEAWRSLRAASVKVFVDLFSRYNGRNNGLIHFGCGSAAKRLHMSKSTISRSLKELEAKGFLERTRDGNWSDQVAAEFRLTHRSDDRPGTNRMATNEWRGWSATQS